MPSKYVNYINNFQKKLTFELKKDLGIQMALPNPFISPSENNSIFSYDQFYWDSYFIILGLVESDKKENLTLAKGMVENFAFLCKKFHIIPSRNRYYNLGISQPPFFTSMVLEIYKKTKNKIWLKDMANVAEIELNKYWMDSKKVHKVHKGLSRYIDHWHIHLTAEHESGWDMTSRFFNKCMDFLPIDLNCLLYKYETDLTEIYKILKNKKKSDKYHTQAKKRKNIITELMWDDERDFFYDYDYKNKCLSSFDSIAGFYPLWANIATKSQAKKMLSKLKEFEFDGGLVNTLNTYIADDDYKQWDFPNGWPNQQWIVIKGLLNYGYKDDAKRIAKKWINLNKIVFDKTGFFWEKYDVVNLKRGKSGRYPTLKGFGWTNGIFIKLVKLFNI